jgi:hypothetical protein
VSVTEHARNKPQSFWSSDPMIPGGRDGANLTHREPGAVGGLFTGADIPAAPVDWLDEVTAREHAKEGGEDPRRPSTHHDTHRKGSQ